MGNTLVNVVAAAIGYTMAERLVPLRGELVSIPAMTLLILILGEIFPKRLALMYPTETCVVYAPVLALLNRFLHPFAILLEWTIGFLKSFLQVPPEVITESEFRSAVGESQERGVLDKEERMMVDGIIRLEGLRASEVMTPRVDCAGIDLTHDPSAYEGIARKARFRYLPLFRETLDRIEGFLDAHRFLLDPARDIRRATLPPLLVPETMPLDALLVTFQKAHARIACVTDEFGGTAGIVTRGDVLEEIIRDVDSEQRAAIRHTSAPNAG